MWDDPKPDLFNFLDFMVAWPYILCICLLVGSQFNSARIICLPHPTYASTFFFPQTCTVHGHFSVRPRPSPGVAEGRPPRAPPSLLWR